MQDSTQQLNNVRDDTHTQCVMKVDDFISTSDLLERKKQYETETFLKKVFSGFIFIGNTKIISVPFLPLVLRLDI